MKLLQFLIRPDQKQRLIPTVVALKLFGIDHDAGDGEGLIPTVVALKRCKKRRQGPADVENIVVPLIIMDSLDNLRGKQSQP